MSEQGRVVVRVRPTFVPEVEALGDSISFPSQGKVAIASGTDREAKEFVADRIYVHNDGDDAVYTQEVQALVQSVHQGYKATILAYGASGSGKTHTVLGNKECPGLADRIIDDLFALYDPRTCTVAVAIQELYNEVFTDLVATLPGQAAAQRGLAGSKPPIKQLSQVGSSSSSSKSPARFLEGREVRSSSDLKQLVHAALRKRQTATTLLNASSSRSHAIITLTLLRKKRVSSSSAAVSDQGDDSSPASSPGTSRAASRRCSSSGSLDANSSSAALESPRSDGSRVDDDYDGGVFTYFTGKLYLVDLAGSENIKRSGAEGKQQVEAGRINQSLCHLKTVIDQVFQGKRVATYRNSELTRKLQDALGGGNSKLLLIACISTARENLALTRETLRFAEMARCIKNKPTVNREPKDELITRLQRQIEELQDQLAEAARLNKSVGRDQLLLQELNAVQAAYAELQEDMEVKKSEWAADAEAAEQRSSSLQQQLAAVSRELCATNAREAALQRQQAANQAEIQQLQQALQQAEAKQAESAALLGSAESDLQLLRSQCGQLQQQLATQQSAADTASELYAEQQRQAHLMQQQLKGQAEEATALQQLLQQESAARTAAEQLAAQQVQHIEQEKAARAAVEQSCSQLGQQLQQEAASAAAANKQIEQQLAASQQQLQIQKQDRLAAETQLSSVGANMQQAAADCSELQQRLDAECITSQRLRQELSQQQQQLQSERQAAAERAAQLGEQMQRQREVWQQAGHRDRATIMQLHDQAACDKAAHAAQVAEMQQRHAEALDASLQHSVQKLHADKLRCKEYMTLQVNGLRAEAQSLSEALAVSMVGTLPETPTGMKPPAAEAVAVAEVEAEAVAEELGKDVQLPEQMQQQQRKQNSRYQQLAGQLEDDDDHEPEQQQQLDEEAAEQQGQEAQSENLENGADGETDRESGAEPSPSAASGNGDSSISRHAFPSPFGNCTDSPVGKSSCSLTSAYPQQRDEAAGQRSQPRQQQQHGASRSSGGSVHVTLPLLSMAGLQEAAAAEAEGVQGAAGAESSWPAVYRAGHEQDQAAAQRAFAELAGEELKVEPLKAFLKHCRLGGKLHSTSLPCGQRKLKHHLIQDMLAYHQHAMALRSSSSSAASGRRSSSFSTSHDGACSIMCRRVSEASGGAATTNGLLEKPSSSGGVQEAVKDLCTSDTSKAAVAAAAAAVSAAAVQRASETPGCSRQQMPRTPRSFALGSSKGAAASGSPASGSGIWGWLTPRSSKKKQKAAAAAAGSSSSSGFSERTACMSPMYDCDIAASPAAGADALQRRAGPAAVAEGVVGRSTAAASSLAGTGSRSAVEMLMLQMQSDPTLGSPGPAVPVEALLAAGYGSAADSSSATGDVRVLQQGGSLAQRSSCRHAQARAAAKKSSRQ